MPKWAVLAILAVAVLIPVVFWSISGAAREDGFVDALRAGEIHLPVDIRGKQWTEQELATAEVIALPGSTGREQALGRSIHDRGRLVISPRQFEFQGTITDAETGIVHVFGFPRKPPHRWRHETIHPSSIQKHIDRRVEQLEEMKRQYRTDKPSTTDPGPE